MGHSLTRPTYSSNSTTPTREADTLTTIPDVRLADLPSIWSLLTQQGRVRCCKYYVVLADSTACAPRWFREVEAANTLKSFTVS
jgi:hypothetical protein